MGKKKTHLRKSKRKNGSKKTHLRKSKGKKWEQKKLRDPNPAYLLVEECSHEDKFQN